MYRVLDQQGLNNDILAGEKKKTFASDQAMECSTLPPFVEKEMVTPPGTQTHHKTEAD